MLRLNFTKFTSTCSPLELYPELTEEQSWLLPETGVGADNLRRYVLLMFSVRSPLHSITDLGKRRERALQGAGVTRRVWETKEWQNILSFAHDSCADMVQALMKREQSRRYEMWLSKLIAFSMMMRELREGVAEGTEADKKTLAFERKLKVSLGVNKMEQEITELEKILFEGDETVTSTITAMGQKQSARQGGWAERFAS